MFWYYLNVHIDQKSILELFNIKAIEFSIGGFEWIFINLFKSVAFSLQTSENNLKPP